MKQWFWYCIIISNFWGVSTLCCTSKEEHPYYIQKNKSKLLLCALQSIQGHYLSTVVYELQVYLQYLLLFEDWLYLLIHERRSCSIYCSRVETLACSICALILHANIVTISKMIKVISQDLAYHLNAWKPVLKKIVIKG